MLRFLPILFIPIGLYLFALFLYPAAGQLPESQLVLLIWLPLAMAFATLVLCLRFNRSRIFFVVLGIALSYGLLNWQMGIGNASRNIIWSALCFLLPFYMLVFSLLKERGTFTLWGATRFALLFIPFLIVTGFAHAYPEAVYNLLHVRLFKLQLLSSAPFPEFAVGVMLLAFIVLNGRMFARPGAQNAALFIGFVAAITMLYFKDEVYAQAVFALAALFILSVAVIQESWSMAYIDQLTGLPGRRALEEAMLKLGSSYSIAMVDIDHFKKFNDRHGHDAGDQVLSMVASRIRQSLSQGKCFRYGGEEFTILFPGKNTDESLERLEDVREVISGSKFHLRESRDRRQKHNNNNYTGKKVTVTISAGVAERNDHYSSPDEVIKAADEALYKAKKQGRNRVCQK